MPDARVTRRGGRTAAAAAADMLAEVERFAGADHLEAGGRRLVGDGDPLSRRRVRPVLDRADAADHPPTRTGVGSDAHEQGPSCRR